MKDITLPNYKDGSIVNLMSSIGAFLGARSQYAPLKIFPSKYLKNSKNIAICLKVKI